MNEENKLIGVEQTEAENAAVSMDQDLPFSNCFMFAKVMSEEPLCREMLQRILGVKIRKIMYIEPEKSIINLKDAKSVRLDVYVEDAENTVYDIECQTTDIHELPKRSRYYQSQIDSALLERGYHYSQLKKSYVIFVCCFDPFEKGRHVYDFTRRCVDDETIELKDDTHILFLNATGKKDDCSPKLRKVLDYMDGRKVEDDDFVRDIDKSVALNNKDKIWRKNMMTLEMEYMTREIVGEKRGEERGRKLAREDDRFSDVSAGLYSPEKGAELLDMKLEDFMEGMKKAGYKLPEEVPG